jgi:hypothetical protein
LIKDRLEVVKPEHKRPFVPNPKVSTPTPSPEKEHHKTDIPKKLQKLRGIKEEPPKFTQVVPEETYYAQPQE